MPVGIIRRLLIHIDAHLQIDEDGALSGIDATLQYAYRRQHTHIVSVFVAYIGLQRLVSSRHLWQHTQLVLVYHLANTIKVNYHQHHHQRQQNDRFN